MPTVTIVGSFCVDILIRADRLPVWGETLIGRDFYLGPGGKGGNMAAAVARLGATTHFVTAVGEDQFARLAFDLARDENIDPTYIQRIPGATTSIGFGLLDPAGRSACITDLAALSHIDEAFVDAAEEAIARCDAVVTMLENPLGAARRAMELGRKHGKLTILNPAPALPLPDDLLAGVDILTPNESELRILLGLPPDDPTPDLELAQRLTARGVRTLILTQGEKGALLLDRGTITQIPPIPVSAVDSTGAGDAFNAALAVALAEEQSLHEALQLATCAGAVACTRLGSIPSYARRDELERLRSRHFS
jgi:ribokinase